MLLVAVLAQDTLLQSDSETTTIGAGEQDSTVAPAAGKASLVPDKSADTAHLSADSLKDGSKWVYNKDSSLKPVLYPIGWTIKYHSNLYTDCPQNPAILYVAASSYFTVYLNGVVVGTGTGWQIVSKFTLKLNCGCNNLTIVVYNKFWSPCGVVYSVKQDKTKCYDCENLGVTFYNRDTCKCECVGTCSCKSPLAWFEYPTCGCKCGIAAKCLSTHYFNRQTCSCDCPSVCCPEGLYQDLKTCKCMKSACDPRLIKFACPEGTRFNFVTCQCETIFTIMPVDPNPCVKKACTSSQVWKPETCICEPIARPISAAVP